MFDQTALVIWAVCSGLWCAINTLWLSILWARIKGAEQFHYESSKAIKDDFEKLEGKVPESRLQEVEGTIEAFRSRIDSQVLELATFRERIYKDIQRMDAIMRRNERAVIKRAEQTLSAEDDGDGTPDEIPLDGETQTEQRRQRPSKAQLRELLRRQLRSR